MKIDADFLEKISQKVDKKLVNKTGLQINALLSRTAKGLAHVQTGNMRNQIDTVGQILEVGDTVYMIVTSNAEYAAIEEYRGDTGGGKPGPHAYMRPALYDSIDVIKNMLANDIKEAFED